jgi:hypothetical protein
MNGSSQAPGKTRGRVEKIAHYVIQFVAVVAALQVGRIWDDYPWYWNLLIDFGIYVAVIFATWMLYRGADKIWVLYRRTP